MFGNTFYFGFVRKYVTVFGTLFNNISIERPKDDSTTQTIKVPLTYSSQDKMLARLNSDPDLDRKVAAISPAISFEVGSPYYDAQRKLQSTLKRCLHDPVTGNSIQFLGVPYNFEFTLRIYSKQEEDGLRVLEQILPYFTPSMTVTVNLVPEMNYKVDVPIVLDSVDFENNSYGSYPDRRNLIWTLKFTLKGEFSGPIESGRKNIRIVHVNLRDQTHQAILEEVHIEPGLTANGEPTSVRAESVPVTQIQPDDDYGYIIEILEGPEPHDE